MVTSDVGNLVFADRLKLIAPNNSSVAPETTHTMLRLVRRKDNLSGKDSTDRKVLLNSVDTVSSDPNNVLKNSAVSQNSRKAMVTCPRFPRGTA